MGWDIVAQGTSFYDLQSLIENVELTKGTKLRVVMELSMPIGWAFDVAGAELLFKPFIPEGMDLVDVYGEGSRGIVDMEADPAWFLVVLAFIKAHWLFLVIAGFLLTAIIVFITISIKLPEAGRIPFWLMVGAALGVSAIIILRSNKKWT